MILAQAVARALRDLGVRHVFGAAGHSIFELIDAIGQEPGIDYVYAQGELGAAHMAEAYAKATRNLGVCLAGVDGATNLFDGLAYATYTSTPVLAFAATGTTSAAMARPFVKAAFDLTDLGALEEAMRVATAPPRGPVWLAVDEEVLRGEPPSGAYHAGLPDATTLKSEPSPGAADGHATPAPAVGAAATSPRSAISASSTASEGNRDGGHFGTPASALEAAAAIDSASAPLVFVGDDAFWASAEGAALELAKRLGVPILTARSQKGLIPETHPLSLGCQGVSQLHYEADLVLAIAGANGAPAAARTLTLSDAGTQALIAQLRAQPREGRAEAHRQAWRDERAAKASAGDQGAINQWRFYQELGKQLRPEAIVSSPDTRWLIQGLESPCKVHLRAFGHGLSAALGVKYAQPDEQVVCISGDGSFMMELQELMTLAQSGFALPIFITRNLAFGALRRIQEERFEGRALGTDVWSPDLKALAQAFDAGFLQATRPAELPGVIEQALASDKAVIVDIVCPNERG